ncbi:MAG: T9SS type A sorting domain-containing protein [Ignavibacteria bacterium]|nr:T9SS type A sorting domain-containing protein [Ignavibacteria bacterium]
MKKFSIGILFLNLFIVNLFLAQKGNDILPVELIYFEAHRLSNGVLLRWGTATEVNNFGFEVQRADSTKHFLGIDFVPGSGTSNSPKHYFYIDSTITESGRYYYRLKQIDIDGHYRFSDTVQIFVSITQVEQNKTKEKIEVNIFNNLSSKELQIEISNLNDISNFEINLFNLLGQKVFEKKFDTNNSILKINYNYLSSGIYFLAIHSRQRLLITRKFIVIH